MVTFRNQFPCNDIFKEHFMCNTDPNEPIWVNINMSDNIRCKHQTTNLYQNQFITFKTMINVSVTTAWWVLKLGMEEKPPIRRIAANIFNLLKHQQFNIQQLYALPTLYLCVLYLSEKNSDLCHLQHKLIGFYNRDEKCLLRGTNWVFK